MRARRRAAPAPKPAARAKAKPRVKAKVAIATTPPGSTEAHTALVNRCRIWISDHGGLSIQNNTGALFTGRGTMIAFGLKGSSDIIGCWRGRFLACECKTGGARLSAQQELFKAAVLRAGGLHVTARSTNDLEATLA